MSFLKLRINRTTYWTMLGLVIVLYAAANAMGFTAQGVSEGVLLIVCVPRLHDIGRSGWWFLVLLLIEIVGIVTAFALFSAEEDITAAIGVTVLVVFALLVALGILPGQSFANRWGEPPEPGVQWKRTGVSNAR